MTNDEVLEDLRGKKAVLKALMESPGWGVLCDYYQSLKIGGRNAVFGTRADGMDELISVGQKLSELAGMDVIMTAPQILLEDLDLEEKALLEEIRNEDQSFDE